MKDYYLIDFVDFEICRKNHLINRKMRVDVLNTRAAIVESMTENDNSNRGLDNMIPLSSVSIFAKLETKRKKLQHQADYHKKDLLYYRIIDLVTSNSDNAIHKVFTKSKIRKYNDHYKSNFNINTAASKFAKEILQIIFKRKIKITST